MNRGGRARTRFDVCVLPAYRDDRKIVGIRATALIGLVENVRYDFHQVFTSQGGGQQVVLVEPPQAVGTQGKNVPSLQRGFAREFNIRVLAASEAAIHFVAIGVKRRLGFGDDALVDE